MTVGVPEKAPAISRKKFENKGLLAVLERFWRLIAFERENSHQIPGQEAHQRTPLALTWLVRNFINLQKSRDHTKNHRYSYVPYQD